MSSDTKRESTVMVTHTGRGLIGALREIFKEDIAKSEMESSKNGIGSLREGGDVSEMTKKDAEVAYKNLFNKYLVPPEPCKHERLSEDGICRKCGQDCRGI